MKLTWFLQADKAHAQKLDADPAERLHGMCGVQPLANTLPKREIDSDTQRPPVEACRTCLMEVAMMGVEPEDIEEVRARGYEPVREEDLAERGLLDQVN